MKTIYTFSQKKINWVIFLIFLIISFPIYSQIPNTISYQGVLKDASNNLINGKKDLLFNIYESETGGTSKWSETHTQVDINNSFFNVILGEINSLSSLPFNVQYWLKITVDGSEMTPRLKLTSVPYSLNAKSLYLPFVGLNNTNDDTFKLETIGTGGGLRIELNNNNNDQPAIRATTSGIGRVAWFTNTNANNTATLFDITQFGTGRAMVINNTYNTNNEALRINYGGSDRALFINSLGTGHAFWASAKAPGLAGVFDGKVEISGDLDISGKISKGSGSFIIDHPLDPKNKVLSHSFVESPEMMNIYKGRGKLINGKVEIKLPKYFDALNDPECREINLTSINGWSPLYLEGEINDNKFVIRTTEDGNQTQEFSWVIYAKRNDPYAKSNPIIVEEVKGVNNKYKKGVYLHPELFNKDLTLDIK